MLIVHNPIDNTRTFVVGHHVIYHVPYETDNSHKHIPMINLRPIPTKFLPDGDAKDHRIKVLTCMRENPHKWGKYENWREALEESNYNYKVVESVARQYQELDYMLNIAEEHELLTMDIWYIIQRIEFNYKAFYQRKVEYGPERAVQVEEEYINNSAMASEELGFADRNDFVGANMTRRRIIIGGSPVTIDGEDSIINKIRDKKLQQCKSNLGGRKNNIAGFMAGLLLNSPFCGHTTSKSIRKNIFVSYEDIITHLQEKQEG